MNKPVTIDYKANSMQVWNETNPALAARGIDEPTWNSLCTTIYPGAKPDSIIMAIDYCSARQLDVMLKPVHLVPMNVKNAQTGNYEWRDVPMPGIGMYRIQSARSGNVAGIDEPIYGDMITQTFTDKNGKPVSVTFPEWCLVRVHKLIEGRIVSYSAKEYWIENYASEGKSSDAPNAMWRKRPRGQIAKCAEAQALRKGWPEIDQGPTAEEMEGKFYDADIKDINQTPSQTTAKKSLKAVVEQQPEAKPASGPDFDHAPETELQVAISRSLDCQTLDDLGQWWTANNRYEQGTQEYAELSAAYFARQNQISQGTM